MKFWWNCFPILPSEIFYGFSLTLFLSRSTHPGASFITTKAPFSPDPSPSIYFFKSFTFAWN